MNKIKVICCRANEEAEVVEIYDELETLQEMVGGYIECYSLFSDAVSIICNEEGKILGLPINRLIKIEGKVVDMICGPMLIVGTPDDSDTFTSLTEEQLEKYMDIFGNPPSAIELIDYLLN